VVSIKVIINFPFKRPIIDTMFSLHNNILHTKKHGFFSTEEAVVLPVTLHDGEQTSTILEIIFPNSVMDNVENIIYEYKQKHKQIQ